jgi:hypothetical protein
LRRGRFTRDDQTRHHCAPAAADPHRVFHHGGAGVGQDGEKIEARAGRGILFNRLPIRSE